MLHVLGISQIEERVYLSLLDRAPASVSELADRLEIERRTVAVAVLGLEAKALINRTGEADSPLAPTPPDVGLSALVDHRQRELNEASMNIRPLVDQYRRGQHERPLEELIELCIGREAVARRFEQLQLAAREQVRVFVMPPYMINLADNHIGMQLLREGVRLRAVYQRDAIDQPGAPAQIQRFVDAGEEARISRILPTKLMIGDDSRALIPIHSDPEGVHTSCIVVHPCGLLTTLIALFELIWSRAQPFDLADSETIEASESSPLSRSDHALLSLLLTGLTDRAAGRELGVSERTIQRRVHDVMTRVDAQNRLQLGWQLARQQWLSRRSARGAAQND
jgi:sugar-specific transcriptional regulator TrmB